MPNVDAFGNRYAESDALLDFSLEESIAFADLAFLVIMIDRNISDEELQTVSEQLLGLAFESQEQIDEEYGERGRDTQETVADIMGDDAALDDFVRQRANRIEGGAHREQALEMLATLAYADGLDPSEEDACFRIGRAFGFPSEMVRVTFDEVAG